MVTLAAASPGGSAGPNRGLDHAALTVHLGAREILQGQSVMLNVVIGPGGKVQVAMDASDAVSLIGELGKVANDDSALTNQLLVLLTSIVEKNL